MEYAIIAMTIAFGLYMAWNIGANDVANAFATSVGSGVLTIRKAIVLAAIFEFGGAFFVGSHVSETIRCNIVRPELFVSSAQDFAIGMLAALLAASLWLHLATYLGQPVSTTHAIVGAVMGFGVMAHGFGCVQWHKMARIAASWFVSPLAGAALGFVVYHIIRKYVLGSADPVARARKAVPLGLGIVIFIVMFSVFRDVVVRFLPENCGLLASRWACVLVAGICGFLSGLGGRAILVRGGVAPQGNAEQHGEAVERWFGHLQILTACYMSFAHGANDVANAAGPVAGVIRAMQGIVLEKACVPAWVLAIGGVGIVLGLATYGYKVIESVGRKITEITPTRGFSAEFGTATTVLVCSLMGLPISTTFVLVGAVLGVGLARGIAAIDLKVVRGIFMSWLITIPASAAGAAGIYLLLKLVLRQG